VADFLSCIEIGLGQFHLLVLIASQLNFDYKLQDFLGIGIKIEFYTVDCVEL